MIELSPSLQVAQTLQNRVGNTLGSLQMLSPQQTAMATLTAGASSIGTAVLSSIKVGQDKILESTDKVVELLTTQVKIAEEAERRAREKSAELAKEKQGTGPNTIPIEDGDDKGKFKLDKEGMFENLDVGDIAALATAGGLLFKNVAKKIIKGGVKGGFYGVMASFLAKPAIDFLEEGILKIDIPEEDEKKLENAIIAGATLYALGGIPAALVGIGAVGVNSLVKYLTGEQEKFSAMDATMLFAGGVGLKLLSAKAVTALTAAGWAKSAGILAAFTATPVLVGVGVAIALGIAVNELVKFNEKAQDRTLEELNKITEAGEKELARRFAEQEESFMENIGFGGLKNLFGGELTDLGKAKIGTEQALDIFKDEDRELSDENKKSLLKSFDALLNLNKNELSTVLNDVSKTDAVLDIVSAARQLAIGGAFGDEESKKLLIKLLKFSSNLQVASKNLEERGEGTFITTSLAKGKGDLLEIFNNEYMDNYNKFAKLQKMYDDKDKEVQLVDTQLAKAYEDNDKDEILRLEKLSSNLITERGAIGFEKNQAQGNMNDIKTLGLFREGRIKFDPMLLKEILGEEDLNKLIQGALKNELFKMNSQNIDEMAAFSDRQKPLDIKTAVSSTSKTVNEGDVIAGQANTKLDGHLQKTAHPLYGYG